jgi:DNA (cytosine-5)-methyltransferase 1
MAAYYNEIEPYAVQWLRNLIAANVIAPGIVDDRSIRDVQPADLEGFTQCHFFAGVGVWSAAARAAGWHDDRPLWTGSCPCQPFSANGAGLGFNDARHLWPAWESLIRECWPDTILGEQVDSPAGRAWLDLVSSDLESGGYAIGASVLCSGGFGAPNNRPRIYWVADAESGGRGKYRVFREAPSSRQETGQFAFGDAPFSPWESVEWLTCLDGMRSPIEPRFYPLAARYPGDVGKLRAYGNAINFVVAREFIAAAMECLP